MSEASSMNFVDASALITIIPDEPDADELANRLETAQPPEIRIRTRNRQFSSPKSRRSP
jgi:uncharacterized protein with PIN domain